MSSQDSNKDKLTNDAETMKKINDNNLVNETDNKLDEKRERLPTLTKEETLLLQPEQKIDVRDYLNSWHSGVVIAIGLNEVLVQYDNRSEWIKGGINRLAADKVFTGKTKNEIKEQILNEQEIKELKLGSVIDAQDKYGKWYTAEIKAYAKDGVLVHFFGWDDKNDEIIKYNSNKIAIIGTKTTGINHSEKCCKQTKYKIPDIEINEPYTEEIEDEVYPNINLFKFIFSLCFSLISCIFLILSDKEGILIGGHMWIFWIFYYIFIALLMYYKMTDDDAIGYIKCIRSLFGY